MIAIGDIIDGKWEVVRLVGEGGMGAVYEGRNVRVHRRVAIKIMHASFAEDEELVLRFEREAQAAARIGSEHIVDVLDMGALPDGDHYMIMEFLDGQSMYARIQERGQLPAFEVAQICIQLLAGLSKVHAAGIIHRDLKPPNIFLVPTPRGDFVKILDFGICKAKSNILGGPANATGVGSLLGTLPYMAPEHFERGSAHLDERADIYSVGVILYRAVTGRLPYRGNNVLDLMMALREGRAPHVCEVAPEVDRGFADVVDRAMEWSPEARWSTAEEMQGALLAWAQANANLDRMLSDFLDALPEPPKKHPGSAILGVAKVVKVATPREPTAGSDLADLPPRSRPAGTRRGDRAPSERRVIPGRVPARPPPTAPIARPPTPDPGAPRPRAATIPLVEDPGAPRARHPAATEPETIDVPPMRAQAPTINAADEIAELAAKTAEPDDATLEVKRRRASLVDDPQTQRRRRAHSRTDTEIEIPIDVEIDPSDDTLELKRRK